MIDNYGLYEMYEAEQEEEAEKLPECCECGERIDGEYLYDIDGDLYCEECMMALFKKQTENYMD